MLFLHLCRGAAVLGLIFGMWQLWLAYYLGTSIIDPTDAKRVSDMNLHTGMTFTLYSIGLGTLAEISFSLRKKSDG